MDIGITALPYDKIAITESKAINTHSGFRKNKVKLTVDCSHVVNYQLFKS